MNTIDALAETQEKYNKLRDETDDLLIGARTAIEQHETRVAELEQQYKRGVITDTEFVEETLRSVQIRDRSLAADLNYWQMKQS